MKKIILPVIILSAILVSCKKDKAPGCEMSVTGIAANYKITKVEVVSASGNSDVTSTVLDNCRSNAFYQLKTDRSFVYTEIGSACTGSGSGSWDVNNNKISISGAGGFQFSDAPITSWNCTTLTVTEDMTIAGTPVNGKFTFVKQ